jgi:hypothetical protein
MLAVVSGPIRKFPSRTLRKYFPSTLTFSNRTPVIRWFASWPAMVLGFFIAPSTVTLRSVTFEMLP